MIDKLIVLWREPHDSPGRGTRHEIGTLWRDEGRYFFAYDVTRASAVQDKGFRPPVEFPVLRGAGDPYSAPYLFATFNKRIPSPKRPDFDEKMKTWGIVRPDDQFEILATTGGLLLTDRLELAEWRAPGDDLWRPLQFRLAGAKFDPQNLPGVGQDSRLTFEPDPTNVADPDAVRVLVDGKFLGYVPRQYSAIFARRLREGAALHGQIIRWLALPADSARWLCSAQAS